MDTAILDGMRVYYNYAKKHGALEGKTPAEASLKWMGLTNGKQSLKMQV